ncbi:MAG: hypothetical protein K2K37_12690, partial [Muribaculaceae bacterium]|nr:hypothetical protein [Muribaculaceae bacterium]
QDKNHIQNPLFSVALARRGGAASLWVLKSVLYWIFGLSFIVTVPTVVFSTINFIKDLLERQSK